MRCNAPRQETSFADRFIYGVPLGHHFGDCKSCLNKSKCGFERCKGECKRYVPAK